MPDYQNYTIVGRLTKDPKSNIVGDDLHVCNFTVATNRWKKGGEKVVHFQSCTVWGKQAEACSQYLFKGDPVMVVGYLETSKWDSDDGQKHSITKCIAQKVVFLRSKKDGRAVPQDENEDSQVPPEERDESPSKPGRTKQGKGVIDNDPDPDDAVGRQQQPDPEEPGEDDDDVPF